MDVLCEFFLPHIRYLIPSPLEDQVRVISPLHQPQRHAHMYNSNKSYSSYKDRTPSLWADYGWLKFTWFLFEMCMPYISATRHAWAAIMLWNWVVILWALRWNGHPKYPLARYVCVLIYCCLFFPFSIRNISADVSVLVAFAKFHYIIHCSLSCNFYFRITS